MPIDSNGRPIAGINGWEKGTPPDLINNTENKMKNHFDMQHYTMNEGSLPQQIVQRMFAEGKGDVIHRTVRFVISQTVDIDIRIINKIKEIIPDIRSIMPHDERTIYILGTHNDSDVFIQVLIQYDEDVSNIDIRIYTNQVSANIIKELLDTNFRSETLPSIKWWFISDRGPSTRDYYLPKDETVIKPEFYPDLGDPDKYIHDYIHSNEAILLIAGPPGTGKTTLLRHMIHNYKLSAHVIYDERIMEQDGPFQTFLFGRRRPRYDDEDQGGDIMIIEDADTILTSRERDNNKLMSRFLNISDGLIKLPNKKLIFTTNITDFGNIDPALLRPGRCFGVMHTRALNLIEAQAAARVANLPIPTEKREYTIAELFNQGKKQQVRTMGFGARH